MRFFIITFFTTLGTVPSSGKIFLKNYFESTGELSQDDLNVVNQIIENMPTTFESNQTLQVNFRWKSLFLTPRSIFIKCSIFSQKQKRFFIEISISGQNVIFRSKFRFFLNINFDDTHPKVLRVGMLRVTNYLG